MNRIRLSTIFGVAGLLIPLALPASAAPPGFRGGMGFRGGSGFHGSRFAVPVVPGPSPRYGFGFGNVVFPGGAPRGFFPTTPPVLGFPGFHKQFSIPLYPYPFGGYGYPAYDVGNPYGYEQQPQQQPAPNVIVIAPPQAQAPPAYTPPPEPPARAYPQNSPAQPGDQQNHAVYLIALKDHTIYSAKSYWLAGTTLNYISLDGSHNQISLNLVDQELTARLNREPA